MIQRTIQTHPGSAGTACSTGFPEDILFFTGIRRTIPETGKPEHAEVFSLKQRARKAGRSWIRRIRANFSETGRYIDGSGKYRKQHCPQAGNLYSHTENQYYHRSAFRQNFRSQMREYPDPADRQGGIRPNRRLPGSRKSGTDIAHCMINDSQENGNTALHQGA